MTSIRRRAVLGGTLAAALASSSVAKAATTPPGPLPGVDGLLALFARTPVVALNEGVHHLQESWDFLAAAMFHPGFRAVDAIVIEIGNSRYQDIADDFVTGKIVRKSELRKIWRDTTQCPFDTGDAPVFFRVLGLARAINLFTSRKRPLRVLLPDPPIDWSQVDEPADRDQFLMQRNTTWADVITREVLDKGSRCVTIGGGPHFFRNLPLLGQAPPGTPVSANVVELIEQGHPRSVSVVHTHSLVPTGRTEDVERHLDGWARPSIADTRRVGYGRLPAADILGDLPPDVAEKVAGLTVADLADQVLFVGRRRELTSSVLDWEVYYEPAYWAELNHRKEVTGFPLDIEPLRHEGEPAMFP